MHTSGKSKQKVKPSCVRPERLCEFINANRDINWDVKDDLPVLPTLDNKLSDIVERVPKSSGIWWSRDRVKYLLNQTFERHLEKINELKTRKSYTYLTAFRRVRNGKSMAEIRFDGIAGCLRTPKGGSARQILLEVGKGEVNIRLLTPRECARLMGVDEFKLYGSLNEALFGFGDAVCVPVIEWLGNSYFNHELFLLDKKRLENESVSECA